MIKRLLVAYSVEGYGVTGLQSMVLNWDLTANPLSTADGYTKLQKYAADRFNVSMHIVHIVNIVDLDKFQ